MVSVIEGDDLVHLLFLYSKEVKSMELSQYLNIVWVMLGSILVFFMQAGFAMVETGFTRAKNASNIIMKKSHMKK